MTGFMAGLAALSYGFPYGANLEDTPLYLYTALAMMVGALWVGLPRFLQAAPSAPNLLKAALLLGLIARGAMFFSTPVLEDDSYRYLWDGAVTAHGVDPYKYAPGEAVPDPRFALADADAPPPDLARLQALAAEHSEPHSRINYPFVATIYPPITQAAFALAYTIDPFGLTGWRLILLVSDFATLGLLIALLRAYGRRPEWALLYWWNPVVILQGFGAVHMDLLVLPFLMAAVLWSRQARPAWAALALAGAAGVKLWPILLMPFIARRLLKRPAHLLLVSSVFAISTIGVLLPQLQHALRPEAGLNAYSSDWQTHAFIFGLLQNAVSLVSETPGTVARLIVALSVCTLTAVLALRFAEKTDHLPVLITAVIAALLFLSPTGYPWYLIWLAPFLCFAPNLGLRALMVTAPLYWLRFPLGDDAVLYQWVIVPIAFGVPLLLLLRPLLNIGPHHEIRAHYSRP